MGTKTTYYLYDLESRLLAEIAGNGRVLREYVWLGQEPVALREYELRPGLYYYINDHLGTPQRLITGEGSVVWQAAYLPFGEAQVQLGTVQNNLRFPGQYFDAETGLHYNWNRYYDPDTGRYLSPDPIGLDGGPNLYAYVENNPVNWVDPWGLAECTYSISKHEVVCTTDDGTTEQVGPDGVFSGQDKCQDNPEPKCIDKKDIGPVQPGDYDMIPSDKYGGSYWLKEGFFKRQLCKRGYGRCEFFFHEGYYSKGCITVNKNNSKAMEEFNNLKEILQKDSNNTMTVVP